MPYEPLPHHNISLFCKNNNTLDRRRCEAKATMQKFVGSVLEAKEVHVLTYEENTYIQHLLHLGIAKIWEET